MVTPLKILQLSYIKEGSLFDFFAHLAPRPTLELLFRQKNFLLRLWEMFSHLSIRARRVGISSPGERRFARGWSFHYVRRAFSQQRVEQPDHRVSASENSAGRRRNWTDVCANCTYEMLNVFELSDVTSCSAQESFILANGGISNISYECRFWIFQYNQKISAGIIKIKYFILECRIF